MSPKDSRACLGPCVRSAERLCQKPRSYETLFAGWKDADLDLPILKQAKAEYA